MSLSSRVIVTGSVGLDDISTPWGYRERVPGGSAVYASLASSIFADTGIIGVAGEDFPRETLQLLKDRSVDTSGLQIKPGDTFRWKGSYKDDMNLAHTHLTELNVMEGFSPSLPEGYTESGYLLLGNIDPEIQLKVIKDMGETSLIAADSMNFWIETNPTALDKVFDAADIVFINENEAVQLTGERNLWVAGEIILESGPGTVVLKQGGFGVRVFHKVDKNAKIVKIFSVPSYPVRKVIDPTGAGDSFAGAFMGYLARTKDTSMENLKKATVAASAAASFTVEGFSLEMLGKISIEDILSRYSRMREIVCFDDMEELK